MPAFNSAEFLDEAVCSILDQTFRDFEFIIFDDGSTDDIAGILQKYAKADSRVRVVPQANEGMITALNRGCRLARGQYIARMDANAITSVATPSFGRRGQPAPTPRWPLTVAQSAGFCTAPREWGSSAAEEAQMEDIIKCLVCRQVT